MNQYELLWVIDLEAGGSAVEIAGIGEADQGGKVEILKEFDVEEIDDEFWWFFHESNAIVLA